MTESNEKVEPSVCTTRVPCPDQDIANETTAGSLGPPVTELPMVWKSRVWKFESANLAVPAPGCTSMLSSGTATVQNSPLGAIPGLKSFTWDARPASVY